MTRYIGRSLLGVCGFALLLALLASPALAIGIEDAVIVQPAATLLLPYFEVDLGPAGGGAPPPPGSCPPGSICTGGGTPGGGPVGPLAQNTLFHIGNASATAILAHVVIWSDLSVPVISFDIYLTGYDVQHVDLREVLNGQFPQTASAGQDPQDTISNKGLLSQDINFASCGGVGLPTTLPYPANIDTVRPGSTAHMRNALTGTASALAGGLCLGRAFGGNIARGYITVDTVNACNLEVPGDPTYFSALTTNQNTLYGDWAIVNPLNGAATGGPLVHIIADPLDPEFNVPGQYTFYGRYVNWDASDHRQPLATTFAARYTSQPPFSGGTSLIVWRDSKVEQLQFTCGTNPPWFPLGQEAIVAFDEQEHPQFPAGNPFPAESQLVQVGGASFPVAFSSGWLFLNLNTSVAAAGANPPDDPAAAQAWVISVHKANAGTLGGPAVDATQLDNASNANHSFPN